MLYRILTTAIFALIPALASAADPIPVSVQRLSEVLVDREVRAPASVISANRAIVTSEVSALIKEFAADVGASVRKDQLLIRLDSDNASLALAQSKAALAAIEAQIVQAKQRLRKAEELLEKNFVSDDELIARQTDLAVLEANRVSQQVVIQQAELALSRTRVRAPFDATVVERQAQVGSFAMPGTPLITLVQTDSREVDAELDPRSASGLSQGSGLQFVSQDRSWPVKLARLSDVIETNTRKLRGRFVFTADAAPVGSTGELVWNESRGLVPVALIVQRGDEFGIFVAVNNLARFVAIPSAQEGRPAMLDMPPDTLIVSRGHIRLQDGDALQISR
ncbi:MAG: efflux RND transporter periplasmic adaptor subunit [Gammaproteobacteria bacterium]|nr:efflux RND transporter periplasmic adaptor subunit [Gammaproteobacteria bacterium]MDH4313677.1 efflux RND transporter periplasmic adaptor subunit [Gammaproteobacteria bacterium]MDH5214606.1 efflux RND transporter periplasmic adaptor subunit [Gammaproteobacteria bacterium]